jgi:RHS repeat-associated protein
MRLGRLRVSCCRLLVVLVSLGIAGGVLSDTLPVQAATRVARSRVVLARALQPADRVVLARERSRGRPVHWGAHALPGMLAVGGRLLAGLSTARSLTYVRRDGLLVTRVFASPVNYRDSRGRWRRIDDTLVESGGGFRNLAAGYAASLPTSLSGAVSVTAGGRQVSFRLQSAAGRATVNGATATYADALPGATVAYTAQPDRLQELVTLHGPRAPRRLVYDLGMSVGLRPRQLDSGGVGFVDTQGRARLDLMPSVAYPQGAPAQAQPVAIRVTRGAGGWRLVVDLGAGWVSRALARGPVVIDPTVRITPDSQDGSIESEHPTTDYGSLPTIQAGYDGTNDQRGLVQFNVSAIPHDAVVLNAALGLTVQATSTSNTKPVGVYQLLRPWTTEATWDAYDGTNSWGSPGASASSDAASTPAATQTLGASTGPVDFYITKLAQGWVDGSTADQGVLIRDVNPDSVANELTFTGAAGGSGGPELDVVYEPRAGSLAGYSFSSQQLDDRLSASVNIANGNLLLDGSDVQLPGTGLPLTSERYYNSLLANAGESGGVGLGGSASLGRDVYLRPFADGSVAFYRGDGVALPFLNRTVNGSTASFDPAPFLDATLTQNTSTGVYTLVFNQSQTTMTFNSSGQLTQIADQNGNHLALVYNTGGGLDHVIDTQGHTISFGATPAPAEYVSQVTDQASRTWGYAYGGLNSSQLTTYTDPNTKTTGFGYDANHRLASITTPAGNVTLVSYDSQGRVQSITRTTDAQHTTGPTTSFSYDDPAGQTACTGQGLTPAYNTVVTDPDGHRTTYCFDAQDRAVQVSDADGRARNTSYTPNGDIGVYSGLGTQSTQGLNTTLTYDPVSHSLTKAQTATGTSTSLTTNYGYAGTCAGNNAPAWAPYYPSSSTNPETQTTSYGHDCAGNLTSVTGPLSPHNTIAIGPYDSHGNPSQSTDPDGNTTHYGYDSLGRLQTVTPPLPQGQTAIGYDSLSRVHTITDGKGQTTTYTLDNLDRVANIAYADGSSIAFTYDADGNLLKRVDTASGGSGSVAYVGRIASATGPSGGTTATLAVGSGGVKAGDAVILVVHTSNATGTPSASDSAGNTYRVDQGPILDGGGDATTILSAQNAKALSSGQHITVTMPSNSEYFVAAEEFSGLSGATDGSSSAGATNNTAVSSGAINTTTAGDLLFGAIGWESGSTPSAVNGASWTANTALSNSTDGLQDYYGTASATGSYKLAANESGNFPTWMAGIVAYKPAVGGTSKTTSYTYDPLNRLTGESFPGGGSNGYGYDKAGNLTSLTDASGTTTYGYDAANLLTSLTEPGASSSYSFHYDPHAFRDQTTYPNSVIDATPRDGIGRITSITATHNTTTLQNLTYSYLKSGADTELTQTKTNNRTGDQTTYTYDAQNRLTEAKTTNNGSLVSDYQYTYDPAGNTLTVTRSPQGGTTTSAYNADNELCWTLTGTSTNPCGSPPSGATTYTYDADGNQTGNSAGASLAYNAKNQTTTINGTSLSYLGAGQTELIADGNRSLQNNTLGVGSIATPSGTDYYTHDNQGQLLADRGPTGTSYLLADPLGSITATTNSTGSLTNAINYDPYGNTLPGAQPGPFGFDQGYLTTTSLYHYGARYYNPATSNWTQQDPVGLPADLHQADRYVYSGDDPIDNSDPSGECFIFSCSVYHSATGVAVTALGGVITAGAIAGGIACTAFEPEAAIHCARAAAYAGFAGVTLVGIGAGRIK